MLFRSDRLDLDFQGVTRLGPTHGHWASEDVWPHELFHLIDGQINTDTCGACFEQFGQARILFHVEQLRERITLVKRNIASRMEFF